MDSKPLNTIRRAITSNLVIDPMFERAMLLVGLEGGDLRTVVPCIAGHEPRRAR